MRLPVRNLDHISFEKVYVTPEVSGDTFSSGSITSNDVRRTHDCAWSRLQSLYGTSAGRR